MKDIVVLHFSGDVLAEKKELIAGKPILVGRKGCGASIEIDSPYISRKHLYIRLRENGIFIFDPGSLNGISLNGKIIKSHIETQIELKDIIELGPDFKNKLSFEIMESTEDEKTLLSPDEAESKKTLKQHLTYKEKVFIGRDPAKCDILLTESSVSRIHALVYLENSRYWIEDLDSANGTYVNGKRISTKTQISENDKVFIGLSLFRLDAAFKDLTVEAAIQAIEIEKNYNRNNHKKKFLGIRKTSITIKKNQFVALMGPSGCGKSTLLKALNGEMPADTGKVFIHGLDLTENYEFIKRKIGYVPQDDIVHKDLGVYESLYFSAKLRMGKNIKDDVIEKKITEALTSLNINTAEIRKSKVKDLSGGQRKRVSIAVELLNNPSILFLDEPTSPLDPETIEEFLKCIKKLTRNGTTVIMVTHKPEDLNYVDKVIFLGTDGYHAYYGDNGDSLLKYFNKKNIIGIYSLLRNSKSAEVWYYKWRSLGNIEQVESKPLVKKKNDESLFLQLIWLTKRYLKLKQNDYLNVRLLIAQPIIIGGLLSLVFSSFNSGVLFLMSISAIWFGVSNAAKEIVSELPIYKRERMFNLNIHTYLLSKITVLTLISFIQLLVFVGIIYCRYLGHEKVVGDDESIYAGMGQYFPNVLFLTWIAFSATLLGLMISACFSNSEKVMTVVPIALIPQIMLAGVVTPIANRAIELFSYLSLGRWGTEGLARLQDIFGNGFIVTVSPLNESEPVNQRIEALETLNLCNEDLFCVFKDYGLNGILLITLTINLLVYILNYIFLKRYDSIS